MSDSEAKRRVLPAVPVMAVIALVSGLWFGPGNPAMAASCRKSVMQDVGGPWCKPEFRRVNVADATTTFDDFIGRAGGARPERALALLTAEARAAHEDFASGWADVLAAERVGAVEVAGGYNRFQARYRTFRGRTNEAPSGQVDEYVMFVTMQHTEDSVRIADFDVVRRLDGARQRYAAAIVAERTKTQNWPGEQGSTAGPLLNPGSLVRILCTVTNASGEDWARTPLGWLPRSQVTLVGATPPPLLTCDGHYSAQGPR